MMPRVAEARRFLFRCYRWLRRRLLPEPLFDVPGAGRLDRWIADQLRPPTVSVSGFKLETDPHDHLNLTGQGTHEEFLTTVVEREVAPGNTALDLGAHVGYHTLHLARAVGTGGRVVAFEPHPETFRRLKRNVRRSDADHVQLENRAVSNRSETRELFGRYARSGDYRVFQRGERDESFTVEAVALDDYFGASPPAVHFVKMDLQGAEGLALEGMENCLEHWSSLAMLLEYWPFGLRRVGTDPGTFLRGLESRGFDLYTVEEGHGATRPTSTLAPLKAEQILARYGEDPATYTTLLTLRETSVPALWNPP